MRILDAFDWIPQCGGQNQQRPRNDDERPGISGFSMRLLDDTDDANDDDDGADLYDADRSRGAIPKGATTRSASANARGGSAPSDTQNQGCGKSLVAKGERPSKKSTK